MIHSRQGASLMFWLVIVIIIAVVLGMVPVRWDFTGSLSRRSQCMSNLVQIDRAMRQYLLDHSGVALSNMPEVVDDATLFICPATRHKAGAMSNVTQWTDYVFLSTMGTNTSDDTITAYCPPENHGGKGGHILWRSGSVAWLTKKDFWKIIKQTPTTDSTLSTEGAPSVEK